jgi:hypothetical protein
MATVKRKPLPPAADRSSSETLLGSFYSRNDDLDLPGNSAEIEIPGSHTTGFRSTKITSTAIASPVAFNRQDINQDISPKEEPLAHAKDPSSQRYRIFWYWKWELAALGLVVGLLAAIAALLMSFNGQRVPDWGYSINLSTLLALLATILRALIVMIIGQIISQAKWTWYSGDRSHPLQHLQDFDHGSRGTVGSAFLLPKVLGGGFATALAALVMVFSLAIGPFVQQAIKTTSCAHSVQGMNASLPSAHFVPWQARFGEPNIATESVTELYNAVLASLNGGVDAVENQIGICSTSNCTFPNGDPIDISTTSSFSNVGMCSSCVDVSPLVESVENNDTVENITWSLPNGQSITFSKDTTMDFFVANVSMDGDFLWLGSLLSPEFAQASQWAVAMVTSLALSSSQCGDTATPYCQANMPLANGDKMAGPIAAACALYPCIRRTVPSITNNKLSEVLIDTTKLWPVVFDSFTDDTINITYNIERLSVFDGTYFDPFEDYAEVQLPCRVNKTIYTSQNASGAPNATRLVLYELSSNGTFQIKNVSAPEPCIYRQNAWFTLTVANILKTFLPQTCFYDSDFGINCFGNIWGIGNGMYTLYGNANVTVSAIHDYSESFAMALTNRYRSSFGGSVYVADSQSDLPQGELQGVAWQNSLCTSAQWEWLLLPALLVLLTCFLLLWTVAESWRRRNIEPVWKENVLPVLLYKEKFRERDESALSEVSRQISGGLIRQPEKLLEIDEMEAIAKSIMVRFDRSGDRGQEMKTFSIRTKENNTGKRN